MASLLEHCADLPVRKFSDGENIITEGEQDGEILVLESGSVEIRRHGKVVTTISKPGALFGEVALLLETGHTATAVAVGNCAFHVLDDALRQLAARPQISHEIARTLARRLARVSDRVAELLQRLEFEQDLSDLEMTILWGEED